MMLMNEIIAVTKSNDYDLRSIRIQIEIISACTCKESRHYESIVFQFNRLFNLKKSPYNSSGISNNYNNNSSNIEDEYSFLIGVIILFIIYVFSVINILM